MPNITVISTKLNPSTGENIIAIPVTQWSATGSAPVTLTVGNESTYLGGLFNKDTSPGGTGQYFKWQVSGDYPLSRLTNPNEANFKKLVRDFGTNPATITVNRQIPITSNYTIPSNITLKFENGGGFVISTNITLTIQGSIIAQTFQIFYGAGIVAFSFLVPIVVQVDWFGAKGDGVTDDSVNIQRAVNSSYRNILYFTAYKTYCFINIQLPLSIVINGNRASIKPIRASLSAVSSMFTISFNRTNLTTGLYTGSVVTLSETNKAIFQNLEVYGFEFDAEEAPVRFTNFTAGTWSYINNVSIHDNVVRNSASQSIRVSGSNTYFKGNGYIQKCDITNNQVSYSGAMLTLIANANASLGATSLIVRSLYGDSVSSKIEVGKFFQIGTYYQADADNAGSYATTNAVYRVVGFAPGATPDVGTITLQSGVYNDTSGYTANSSPNTGLRINVLKNSMLLPCSPVEFPTLTTTPLFNGTAGANTITRVNTTAQENGYATSLYVGLRLAFGAGGPTGTYTITAINGDGSLTLDVNLSSSFTSLRPVYFGTLNANISAIGDIKQMTIFRNKLIGGVNAINYSGVGGVDDNGVGIYSDDGDNFWYIDQNEFYYHWITMEGQFGVQARQGLNYYPFVGSAVVAGDTVVTITNPSLYKVIQKDIGGGVPENILTLATTLDANATAVNSYCLGDVIGLDSVVGRYVITEISTNWPAVPTVTIQRFDAISKSIVSGGIANSNPAVGTGASNTQQMFRSYNKYIGSMGIVRVLSITRNKFFYNIRPLAGSNLSVSAHELLVDNNDFFQCCRTIGELAGVKVTVSNNRMTVRQFTGATPIPGVTVNSAGQMRGGSVWFAINCANLYILYNIFDTTVQAYTANAFGISFNPNSSYVYENDTVVIRGNQFPQVSNGLFMFNTSTTISGVSQPSVIYNNLVIADNRVQKQAQDGNYGILGVNIGINTVVTNNNLSSYNRPSEPFFNGYFNTYILGSSNYNILIKDNNSPLPVLDHPDRPFFSKIVFANPRINNQLAINKASAPTTSDILTGQIAVYKNTTTSYTSVYFNDNGIIKDLITSNV